MVDLKKKSEKTNTINKTIIVCSIIAVTISFSLGFKLGEGSMAKRYIELQSKDKVNYNVVDKNETKEENISKGEYIGKSISNPYNIKVPFEAKDLEVEIAKGKKDADGHWLKGKITNHSEIDFSDVSVTIDINGGEAVSNIDCSQTLKSDKSRAADNISDVEIDKLEASGAIVNWIDENGKEQYIEVVF
ncbi:TPA: hypothetical protein KO185_001831 [Clostridioides difficile]|uniref:hypothetical protein n=1 Tax=Clostridioides difficile TaxID=1496 RepID=UPI00038CAB52|nr:hypothetical protein [Clostridioides difficile]EGT5081723.1 hypothetical protein [Clostridioides difficile]EGT5134791.1 hypothetical protein [Clostridioides difficile]EGT5283231.1 hypothetical protein [Clostridioides difficile]EQK05555.1 hypothetical protein QUI_2164 [Clostridioides difficile P59]MBG0194393.1 hypothetical protein [Clostridioides difficile]